MEDIQVFVPLLISLQGVVDMIDEQELTRLPGK